MQTTITIENNVPKVTDFKLNGKLVAVIGYSGGLTFIKGVNLTIIEVEAVEAAAVQNFTTLANLPLA